MTIRLQALGVHLFTATGAVFAMLAMLAASEAKWSLMFLWLIVAFGVDGIDGALARKYDVKKNACLLYTSPSPRDQRGSRMPSSA